jgi:hypothetical protein
VSASTSHQALSARLETYQVVSVVTFAHGSVVNRAFRQMFDNPLVNGATEQAAEHCRLFKGRLFDAEIIVLCIR